ncbi:hypothetical protein K7X08_016719 [Anisodus acutangulus]|uniref:DUF6821 domain-containing protein n=1 Tax=Anisodus acutangulus TaxID=402998 RepID=A0A9Q1LTY6_9SOLA|nr:hypothetical protein K7X08_016719 [Anisodus acutangulus]
MDIDSTELQEWELLHPNSASDSELDLSSVKNQDTFLETEGLIQTNYFAIHSQTTPFATEKGSDESDNPSWVDPKFSMKNSGGFWSGSCSRRSDDPQFEGGNDVGVLENPKVQVGFGGIDEMGGENEVKFGELDSITEVGVLENSKLQLGSGGIEVRGSDGKTEVVRMGIDEVGVVQNSKMEVGFGGIEDTGSENGKTHEEFCSDSGGVGLGDTEEMSEGCVEEKEENERVEGEKRDEVQVSKAGEQKRSLVWWKVPLELLRYCVFKVRPMWAFSVAAAVMGFVILGRRLYKMKKKTKALELKVTVDDKKVSQFMSRAARLNEAFSVVKRVPVIRPQLPGPGISPWPVVNLR